MIQILNPKMSPMSAEERGDENEDEEEESDTNESVDSNPNYFPGNTKTCPELC